MGRHSTQKAEQRPRRMRTGTKVFLAILAVFLGFVILAVGLVTIGVYHVLGGVQESEVTTLSYEQQLQLAEELIAEGQASEEELSGLEEAEEVTHPGVAPAEIVPGIYNYLLLGMDTRDPTNLGAGLTDVNIIVTLDTVNNKIKLTSVMRDTLVNIEGHGQNRINAINALLGPDAMVEFVEKYTGLQIEGYVKVNFSCVTSIINILGGVDMQLSSAEVKTINNYLDMMNEVDTLNPDEEKLTNSGDGVYHLGGKQAVSYMRIRKNMGGEFGRNERQRKVLTEVVREMSDITMEEAMSLVNAIMMYTRTDLSKTEIIQAATMLFNLRNSSIEQMSMPSQDKYSSARCKGMYVLVVDFDEQAERVQRFVLKDLPPDPVEGEE